MTLQKQHKTKPLPQEMGAAATCGKLKYSVGSD